MLAALALSQAVAAADHGAPTPALVPSAERVSTVDGIDRLKAWMAAKKTNSSRVNLRAEESQAVRPPRSLAQVMKAIAESHRRTHEARRIATERADARLADERSWQAAYERPWHAAKEEAVRKLTRKASATAAGLAKRVALPSEVAHSQDQDQVEPAEASEYDGTLADEAASPVDAELRLLRAAELIHGEGKKEDDSEGAAISFLQFQLDIERERRVFEERLEATKRKVLAEVQITLGKVEGETTARKEQHVELSIAIDSEMGKFGELLDSFKRAGAVSESAFIKILEDVTYAIQRKVMVRKTGLRGPVNKR